MLRIISAVTVLGLLAGEGAAQADPVRVVTTLPVYADLVQKIGGAAVEVSAIAAPNEDAHFVRPKPSFALSIRRADLRTAADGSLLPRGLVPHSRPRTGPAPPARDPR